MSDFYPVLLNTESNAPDFESATTYNSKSQNECSDKIFKKSVLIKIRDHEMANNTFVRYCIEVYIKDENHFWYKTVSEKSWNVLRRYSDFDSLRNSLIKQYPACVVPPLPCKVNSLIPWRVVNQMNDSDFIDCRRQRLEWFLDRIIAHPKLGREMLVLDFVRNGDSWSNLTTSMDQRVCSVINWRWINAQSRLIHLFDSANSTSQLHEIIKSKSLSDDSLKVVERGRNLQEHIQTLLSCLSKIEEQTAMMHKLYKNYGEAFHDWCGNEKEVGDALQSFSHLCDNFSNIVESPSTGNRLISMSESGSNRESICNGLSWYEINLLLQELYDYGESWIELAGRMAMIHKRVNRQLDVIDDLKNQLDRLKRGQSPKNGPFSQLKNKFAKPLSTTEISQLTSTTETELFEHDKTIVSLKADKDLFEKCVEEEIEYFETIRGHDLKLVMHSYAGNQLAYSQKCLRLWKRAKQTVE